MANNIQAISSMKRLIFIDNISNEEAQNISNQHKYVICFSNDVDGSETIWKGGKPYSYIRGIRTQSIKVGSSNIKLNVDSNGILSLVNDKFIREFQINAVKNSNNEEISPQNNIYNIYFNDNKFKLKLECTDINGNITLDHPEFLFNYRNNLYEIYYNKIAGTDEYNCTINKLENVTGNNYKQFIITLEDLEHAYNFNIKYYPQNVTWYNSNNQRISSITLDNDDDDITVLFKLDKTSISELNTGYKLNVYIDNILDDNLSIKSFTPDTKTELKLKRSFFNINNINHTLELEYRDPNNSNILTKRFSNILNILTPEVQFTDLFYIGNDITATSINPTEIKDDLKALGWHRFIIDSYNYNNNPIDIPSSISDWCVIIPQTAHLRIKIYEFNDPIDDTIDIDNIPYSKAIIDDEYNYDLIDHITVNNKLYKKLKIKDTSIRKFINIITKD